MSESKRSKITEEHRREAARLKALWDDGRPRKTQAEFGDAYGLGNQANVGHYLAARSPLNAKAAAAFAAELKCPISEFSPRLAAEIVQLGLQIHSDTEVIPDSTGLSGWMDTDHQDPTHGTANAPTPSMQPILAWEHPEDLPEGEFVLIPRLGVHLSAGHGCEQVEIELLEKQPQAFRADWIRKKHLQPQKLASMTADGDSMEERIQHGDALVVDTSQTDVMDGKVYALWYDGGERVKRLYRLPGGVLRIQSDNPKHPTIEVPASEMEHVRIIGRVVHVSGEGGL